MLAYQQAGSVSVRATILEIMHRELFSSLGIPMGCLNVTCWMAIVEVLLKPIRSLKTASFACDDGKKALVMRSLVLFIDQCGNWDMLTRDQHMHLLRMLSPRRYSQLTLKEQTLFLNEGLEECNAALPITLSTQYLLQPERFPMLATDWPGVPTVAFAEEPVLPPILWHVQSQCLPQSVATSLVAARGIESFCFGDMSLGPDDCFPVRLFGEHCVRWIPISFFQPNPGVLLQFAPNNRFRPRRADQVRKLMYSADKNLSTPMETLCGLFEEDATTPPFTPFEMLHLDRWYFADHRTLQTKARDLQITLLMQLRNHSDVSIRALLSLLITELQVEEVPPRPEIDACAIEEALLGPPKPFSITRIDIPCKLYSAQDRLDDAFIENVHLHLQQIFVRCLVDQSANVLLAKHKDMYAHPGTFLVNDRERLESIRETRQKLFSAAAKERGIDRFVVRGGPDAPRLCVMLHGDWFPIPVVTHFDLRWMFSENPENPGYMHDALVQAVGGFYRAEKMAEVEEEHKPSSGEIMEVPRTLMRMNCKFPWYLRMKPIFELLPFLKDVRSPEMKAEDESFREKLHNMYKTCWKAQRVGWETGDARAFKMVAGCGSSVACLQLARWANGRQELVARDISEHDIEKAMLKMQDLQ